MTPSINVFFTLTVTVKKLFRAQEPKAPVTYCDHVLSGVRLLSSVRRPSVRQFTLSTSSPESLDGF